MESIALEYLKLRKIKFKDTDPSIKLFEILDNSTINVNQDDLKDSDGDILSEGLGKCNGIGMLSKENNIGTLIHISGATHPYYIVRGEALRSMRRVKKINDIYPNPNLVNIIHVYHEKSSCYPETLIDEEFNKKGFNNIKHFPIKSASGSENVAHRDILLASREGLLYVFPKDYTKPIVIPFFDNKN